MRLIASLCVAAELLAGCHALRDAYRPPNLIIRADETPKEVIARERREKLKLDHTAPKPEDVTEPGKYETVRHTPVAMFVAAYDTAAEAFVAPPPEPEDTKPGLATLKATTAERMTRLGMNLIETRCDLFFESIGRGSQSVDFLRRQIETISTALIATLGLAGASQEAVAGIGIGGGLATQSIDNYGNVFFFSPDVALVQKLVRGQFALLRDQTFVAGNIPRDFEQAVTALRRYQNVCTAHEIKALVNAAVQNGQPVPSYGLTAQTASQRAVDSVLTDLAKRWDLQSISAEQAALLAYAQEPKLTKEEEQVICANLIGEIQRRMCDIKPNSLGNLKPAGDENRVAAKTAIDYVNSSAADALKDRIKAAHDAVRPIAAGLKAGDIAPTGTAGERQAQVQNATAVQAVRNGVVPAVPLANPVTGAPNALAPPETAGSVTGPGGGTPVTVPTSALPRP